jgi:hypothetical protein
MKTLLALLAGTANEKGCNLHPFLHFLVYFLADVDNNLPIVNSNSTGSNI